MSIKSGILFSFMFALAEKLYEDYPLRPLRKIAKYSSYRCSLLSTEQLDLVEELKVKAWKLLSQEMEGDVNIPIVLGQLYWSFPEIYGKNMGVHMDELDDRLTSMVGMGHYGMAKSVTERYIELIDEVCNGY